MVILAGLLMVMYLYPNQHFVQQPSKISDKTGSKHNAGSAPTTEITSTKPSLTSSPSTNNTSGVDVLVENISMLQSLYGYDATIKAEWAQKQDNHRWNLGPTTILANRKPGRIMDPAFIIMTIKSGFLDIENKTMHIQGKAQAIIAQDAMINMENIDIKSDKKAYSQSKTRIVFHDKMTLRADHGFVADIDQDMIIFNGPITMTINTLSGE